MTPNDLKGQRDSYLQYVKKFNIQLNTVKGLVVYDNETLAVPCDVFFFPVEIRLGESFENFVDRCLTDTDIPCYFIYFQCIRWRQPNVIYDLDSIKYDTIKHLTTPIKTIKVSYISITFNVIDDPLVIDNLPSYNVPLRYKGKEYKKFMVEPPLEMQYAQFFDALDFQF